MKPTRAFAIILYNVAAKRMPQSDISVFAKKIRGWCAKQMLEACGHDVNVERFAAFGRGVKLGDYSGIGVNASVGDRTTIGNDVMMGPNCIIHTRMHRFDRTDIPMRLQGYTDIEPVTIGNDVWLGGDVTIMPGVTIGDGCVIGAGAVVTHDIPPYAVAGGVPARIIRYRKTDEDKGENEK